MSEIYNAWKPIRNYIKDVDPKAALETLRYYSLYSGTMDATPPTPPAYIEVDNRILTARNTFLFPWDMEILAREVILLSDQQKTSYSHDIRKWRDFANLMNKLRYLENAIARTELGEDNVLMELVRISHRQFPFQTSVIGKEIIVRYGKLFTFDEMEPIVLRATGLPYRKIIDIGAMFWMKYEEFSGIEHPATGMDGTDISLEDIEIFLSLFSKPFDEMKELIAESHQIDNTFLYQYSPITAYPLIKFTVDGATSYVCSNVRRFTSQITKGVYYLLYKDRDFDNAFGNSFERYVGDILEASNTNAFELYSQEVDPTQGKRRCDWIIDQESSFTMVECKTKRMAIGGYTIIDDDEALLEQLDKLADAVVQTYEGYLVYRGQGYEPSVYPHGNTKDGSICVVTLENWYLYGNVATYLDEIVIRKLLEKDINLSMIEEVPYEVMGSSTFEMLSFVANKGKNIRELFIEHISSDEADHEFGVFLNHHYKDELDDYDYVLADEMDNILGTSLN